MVSELAKQLGVNASALEFPEVIKFLYDHCEEYVNPTHIVVGLLNKAITEGTQENTRHYSYHFRIVKSDTLIKVPPTHLEPFEALAFFIVRWNPKKFEESLETFFTFLRTNEKGLIVEVVDPNIVQPRRYKTNAHVA